MVEDSGGYYKILHGRKGVWVLQSCDNFQKVRSNLAHIGSWWCSHEPNIYCFL